jgi:threonine synthase
LIAAVDLDLVGPNDRVVVLSTGSGLKDVASAMKAVEAAGTMPMTVEPTLEALKEAMQKGTRYSVPGAPESKERGTTE